VGGRAGVGPPRLPGSADLGGSSSDSRRASRADVEQGSADTEQGRG